MLQFQLLYVSLVSLAQDKIRKFGAEERGDGGGSGLTAVLLAVGGVVAVGVVVAAVAAAISGKVGGL